MRWYWSESKLKTHKIFEKHVPHALCFFEFMISPSDTQPKIKISLTKSFGFGARWNLIYPSRWTQSQWMCWRCSASGNCKWPGGVTRTGRGQPIQADQYHYDLFTNWKHIILNHSALFQTWNCRQSTTSLPDCGLAVPLLYIYIIRVFCQDSGCPTATTTTPVASPAESVPTPTSTSKVVARLALETNLDFQDTYSK